MTLSVHLRPEAEQDIEEAASWYEKQKVGLGNAFLDEALVTLEGVPSCPLCTDYSPHSHTARQLRGCQPKNDMPNPSFQDKFCAAALQTYPRARHYVYKDATSGDSE